MQEPVGHAFISYVREDSRDADVLQEALEAAGIRVWRDKDALWPGDDWRRMIRRAITSNTLVFIACFSSRSAARTTSYQNEEILLAVEQFRLRPPDIPWLIPVRFDACPVPQFDLGPGRTLDSIQRADLFGDRREMEMKRLVTTVQGLLTQPTPDQGTRTETASQAGNPATQAPPDAAITDRWRNTNNGFDVPRLMRLKEQSLSHPGYRLENAPPSMRTAALVACGSLGPTPTTSVIRSRFLAFLGRPPVSDLLDATTAVPNDFRWTAWGDNPRRIFSAVLNGNDPQAAPIAWARLLLREDGTSHTMHDPQFAEFVLHIFPRTTNGGPASAANLAAWRDRLTRALALPDALAHFLTHDLGLTATDESPAQIGVSLDTHHAMTELVDTENITTLAGTSASPWYLGWAIADPAGQSATELTRTWLTQMCDSTLHLDGYEGALDAPTRPPAVAKARQTKPFPGLVILSRNGLLMLKNVKWTLWQRTAWILAIQVSVTNTSGFVIELTRFDLESDPGPTWEERPKLSQDQVNALFNEVRARQEAYGSALLHQMTLQPGDSRTGWFVHHAYLPYPARKGKPYCEFTITDDEGETYTIPVSDQGPYATPPPHELLRLRSRAIEGRRMRERLPADGSMPDEMELRRFEHWAVKVADALEHQPDRLTQFRWTLTHAADPAGIRHSTETLEEIVRALEAAEG